jgi:hypothetical protein
LGDEKLANSHGWCENKTLSPILKPSMGEKNNFCYEEKLNTNNNEITLTLENTDNRTKGFNS